MSFSSDNVYTIRARFKELVKGVLVKNPESAPRAEIEEAIARIYKRNGSKAPSSFVWFDSEMAAAAYIRAGGQDPQSTRMWGREDIFWLAKIAVFDEVSPGCLKSGKYIFDDMMVLTKTGAWWPFQEVVVCCDTPKVVDYKQGIIEYRDGTKVKFSPPSDYSAWLVDA